MQPLSEAESAKKKQHTIYCVLHGIESSYGKYYETKEVSIQLTYRIEILYCAIYQ